MYLFFCCSHASSCDTKRAAWSEREQIMEGWKGEKLQKDSTVEKSANENITTFYIIFPHNNTETVNGGMM